MNSRCYLVLSGVIFGVVGLLHLVRVVADWALVMGPWSVPMAISWLGILVPGALCAWAWTLARRSA